MNYDDADLADEGLTAWPAFVDLLAATSLLFVALLAVVLVWAGSESADAEGRVLIQKQQLADALQDVAILGEGPAVFAVDTTDLLFVRVTLPENATFPTNEWQWNFLQEEARTALQGIGAVLRQPALDTIYREVRVVGHSDQIPYGIDAPFSNWELSAARAAVVARYLVTTVGLNPCKVSATGYGPYRPVNPPGEGAALNSSALSPNRRIELEFVPMAQLAGEEVGSAVHASCYDRGDGTRATSEALRDAIRNPS